MAEVLVAGDFHGDLHFANRVSNTARDLGISEIYQLGDFGIWPGEFGGRFLKGLNKTLQENNQTLYFVDGNHEDHPQILAKPIGKDGFREIRSNIFHIPRGHRFVIDGKIWMGLGGATSLDRKSRREGISWWPEEALTLSDAYRAVEGGPVDVMLTHDCPAKVDIPGLSDNWDADALKDANDHRQLLAAVVNEVEPKILFHGHFHTRYDSTFWDAKIVGLASNIEIALNEATIVLDTETLDFRAPFESSYTM